MLPGRGDAPPRQLQRTVRRRPAEADRGRPARPTPIDKQGAADLLVAARAAPIYEPHQEPRDGEDDRRPHEPAGRAVPGCH